MNRLRFLWAANVLWWAPRQGCRAVLLGDSVRVIIRLVYPREGAIYEAAR